MSKPSILSALSSSCNADPESPYTAQRACQDVAAQIFSQTKPEEIELVLFHTSTSFDLDKIATGLTLYFNDLPTVGCTSAGEFNQNGYVTSSLLVIVFLKSEFTIATALIPELETVEFDQAHKIASSLRREVRQRDEQFDPKRCFVVSFLDGLTRHEEDFLQIFAPVFGNIPHLGGSAGDDLKLESTYVFHNGQFYQNAAITMLVGSKKQFSIFSVDHINTPVSKLVVTNADPRTRTVYELNGEPAAQYYAKLLGLSVAELTPDVFSMSPLAVMVGEKYFIRSIQKVDLRNNSLTFYCAVDIGIILTFITLGDCIDAVAIKLDALENKLGKPEFVYACDCFMRRIEIQQCKRQEEVKALQQKYNIAGFNAYGEHIHSIHLNQTFTGVYFAKK